MIATTLRNRQVVNNITHYSNSKNLVTAEKTSEIISTIYVIITNTAVLKYDFFCNSCGTNRRAIHIEEVLIRYQLWSPIGKAKS